MLRLGGWLLLEHHFLGCNEVNLVLCVGDVFLGRLSDEVLVVRKSDFGIDVFLDFHDVDFSGEFLEIFLCLGVLELLEVVGDFLDLDLDGHFLLLGLAIGRLLLVDGQALLRDVVFLELLDVGVLLILKGVGDFCEVFFLILDEAPAVLGDLGYHGFFQVEKGVVELKAQKIFLLRKNYLA